MNYPKIQMDDNASIAIPCIIAVLIVFLIFIVYTIRQDIKWRKRYKKG